MSDPTYVKAEIDANPAWKLAWWLSEIDNDNAPIGWFRYISIAQALLDKFTMEERVSAGAGTDPVVQGIRDQFLRLESDLYGTAALRGFVGYLLAILEQRDGARSAPPPEDFRERAEALWEELGGDLCICQRADVWHWCESCQRKVQLIAEAFQRAARGRLAQDQEPQ